MKERNENRARCQVTGDGVSRRKFLFSSALLGGSALLASRLGVARSLLDRIEKGELTSEEAYGLAKATNVIYSVCLQCHTDCPIKAKLLNGVLVKIDGPAYSPQAMLPHVKYEMSPYKAVKIDGKVCPKGQAGIQSLYDPYRIVKVLKRSGPRGSNQWRTISFEQAVEEIVNGGYLFKSVKGEEKRYVSGLKGLYGIRDPKAMKALKDDAAKVAKKQMSLADFKRKQAPYLKYLIDSNHPDLGPVNNRFVFLAGRIEHGRKEFSQRWLKDSFGSVNWYEHTTICEQSHHIAFKMATNKYIKGKWSGGKDHMKPDALNSRFIIFFGTGAFEANFGPPPMAEKITEGIISGRLKIAVVDPRFSKTAAKAKYWIPIQPGTDAAFALGMIRWIIENRRYDERFLRNANKAAATHAGESSWTTAAFLVKVDRNGVPGAYLRAAEIGLGGKDEFVVFKDSKPAAVNPYDAKNVVIGDLKVDTVLKGLQVKSAFQLLSESAFSKPLAEWARICGVGADKIVELAREFTSYGKQAVVEFYRGAVQHTNGYYNAQALISLNLLIGNPDWKGGWSSGGGHWHEAGNKKGQPFNLVGGLHPNRVEAFGIKISREKVKYEETTLFRGYPAKRPFYPFTSNLYQEVLPSAKAGYPYRIQALFLHKGTPGLSVPAAQHQIDTLKDLEAIPLFFASDIVIGESSMYADYIFPDLSIWERWGFPHVTPDVQTKTSKVRQPIVEPLTETVRVFGEEMPICMETVMLAIAEKLNLPGYGKNGFGPGMDFRRMEDYYLKMAANIAMGDKPGDEVPAADKKEMDLFLRTRRHLSWTVFNPERWRKAVGADKWRHVVYVLNRGGRYENFDKAYHGSFLTHRFAGLFSLYVEPVALGKHSITGKPFSGIAIYEPIRDAGGRSVKQKAYEFTLITYKDILGGQSRTLPTDYWLSDVLPENYVLMNATDADRLGLSEGDVVRIVSSSNKDGIWNLHNGEKIPVQGKVKVMEGLRPKTVAISWHFGHWAYGSQDVVMDGKRIPGDKRRRTGLCPNVVMLTDPYLKDVCLTDPIGGSSSYYDTRVRVINV